MKIHCGQMVEGALRAALESDTAVVPAPAVAVSAPSGNLSESLGEASGIKAGKLKVVLN
jgi:nitrogen fixation NifU-like protein